MILEYAQLLSTAHRVLDGVERYGISKTGRKQISYDLPDHREFMLYRATHINHPSATWVRQSEQNYRWLFHLFNKLLDEYTHRYHKIHACARLVTTLGRPPKNIEMDKQFSEPTPAMPDEYKVEHNSIASYHNYYIGAKHKMSRWTDRSMPLWFIDGINTLYEEGCYVFTDKIGRIISTSTVNI